MYRDAGRRKMQEKRDFKAGSSGLDKFLEIGTGRSRNGQKFAKSVWTGKRKFGYFGIWHFGEMSGVLSTRRNLDVLSLFHRLLDWFGAWVPIREKPGCKSDLLGCPVILSINIIHKLWHATHFFPPFPIFLPPSTCTLRALICCWSTLLASC